jgi:UDP-GlcNAc:undecaprenyl-phosphate GlcNAc-1-phosphate transferase
MTAFFLLILASAVSMMVIPLAARLAPHLGLIDRPDPRKVHKSPTPRIGGWGIAAGTLVPLVLLFEFDPLLQSFVIGVVALFVFGVWDDACELGHWPKFLGQAIATGVVVFHGGLYVTRLPFVEDLTLPPLVGQLFTMVAMTGAINAINHSDGLDGLAGGESLLSLMAIAYLGHSAADVLVTGIALATIGGTLGFLRYNTHPAQVFMGDSGSQVLGFSLAFLVVDLSQVVNPVMSAAVPALLLGLPIADILVVLYKRASGGMNWFKATRNHVHHRLLDLGFTHFESVVCIYSLQTVLVLCGVLLEYESDTVVAGTYLALLLALFGGLAFAEARGLRRSGVRMDVVTSQLAARLDPAQVRRLALGFIGSVVPVFLVVPSFWANAVPRDIGALSLALAVVLALALVVRHGKTHNPARVVVRTITYVGAAFATFVFTQYPGLQAAAISAVANILIAALAVAIGLVIRFLSERRFVTTPTDYLIALGLLVLATIERVQVGAGSMVQFVTYVVVLFYGCEVVMGQVGRWRLALGLPTLVALAVLSFRGLSGGV